MERFVAERTPLVTDVGVRLPAQLTASGRAMLADLPLPQVRALFPDATAFVDRHGTGPSRLSDLRRLLLAVRGGVRHEPSLAGRPVASVAVTFPSDEVDAAVREDLARRVARSAAELTRRINGHPPPH